MDSKERKIFAQKPHELLIDQHQINFNNITKYVNDSYIPLEFNHPTKAFILDGSKCFMPKKCNLWSNDIKS